MRVRMAPSPTGPLHIGTARTSLYNFLAARHAEGTYVLRIEDTDTARSTAEHERDIIDNLRWLGITWDEGPQAAGGEDVGPFAPYRQSERMELYAGEVERLLAAGAAYRCWCTPDELEAVRTAQDAAKEPPRYNRRCLNLTDAERAAFEAEGRPSAIRFKVEPEKIRFDDLIRGEVEFDNQLLGDFVIVRADGVPLYHLVVVIDDEAMEITDVIRGEDHLSNTPKHIALIRALGYREPRFGHIPLILNADRTKMSKRKSQTAMTDYRLQGYLPEAMVNFLAFLGWSPGTEEEIFTLEELGQRFDLDKVHSGGAVFDKERLEWLNGQWIRRLSDEELTERALPFLVAAVQARLDDGVDGRIPNAEDLRPLIPMVRERMSTLAGVGDMLDFMFFEDDSVAPSAGVPMKWHVSTTFEMLSAARETIAKVGAVSFEAEELETALRALAAERGWKVGDLFMALRIATTGKTATPPLLDVFVALGYERTLARLDRGRQRLAGAGPPPTT